MIRRYNQLINSLTQTQRHTATKSVRKVKIVEVGPRDGLQNEPSKLLTPQQKIKFVQKLAEAGCQFIECGSFVSPKWVPAMANSSEVLSGLTQWRKDLLNENIRKTTLTFSVLTPNLKGFNDAISAGGGKVDEIAIFGAASETFSMKNLGCSIEDSLDRFRLVTNAAKEMDIPVRGYVSCVLGCPYEKQVDPSKVAKVAADLVEMGCHEVSLGDTIGVGNPYSTVKMINEVKVRMLHSILYCQ